MLPVPLPAPMTTILGLRLWRPAAASLRPIQGWGKPGGGLLEVPGVGVQINQKLYYLGKLNFTININDLNTRPTWYSDRRAQVPPHQRLVGCQDAAVQLRRRAGEPVPLVPSGRWLGRPLGPGVRMQPRRHRGQPQIPGFPHLQRKSV